MILVDEDERRRDALLAFMGAGFPSPPAKGLVVSALADARRSVAQHSARNEPIDEWFAGQIRLRGIKESAAFVAALEIAERRSDVAAMYRRRYPDRHAVLDQLLATLSP